MIVGCADAAILLEPVHDDRGGLFRGDLREVGSAILINEGGRAACGRAGAVDRLGQPADVDVVPGGEAVLTVAEDVVVETDAWAELLVIRGLLVERVDRLVLVEAAAEVEAQMRVEVPLVVDEAGLGAKVGTERRRQNREVGDPRVRPRCRAAHLRERKIGDWITRDPAVRY